MNQQTFLKVPFVWEEPKPLLEVPSRLTFEPVKAKHSDQLVSIVARIIALSMDASDQKRASEGNPYAAVEAFLNSARDDFSYQNDWWQFGINDSGDIVGVVLPVTFNGCAKGNLEEETLYYLGVVPEYEGWVLPTIFCCREREYCKRPEFGAYFAIRLL